MINEVKEKEEKNVKNRFLIAKILDRVEFCKKKNKIQTSDFLDIKEQKQIEDFLKIKKITNYFFTGGYSDAERKIIVFYPEKLEDIISQIDLNDFINVIKITLPNDLKGKYSHKNYLGGIMKLGIDREKCGDILVSDDGADIIILPEVTKFLLNSIESLTRFSKSKIELIQLNNLREVKIKTTKIKITVASMRLDNIVAELARCSRNNANELLQKERVFINYQVFTKSSKEVKLKDIITIRGKGRFIIEDIIGNSKKGRVFIEVKKFS